MTHRADWEIEEHEEAADEASDEAFDRLAFAARALEMLRLPPRTTVAICEGCARVRVATGRNWGRRDERWAMVSVPPNASRRAIALAVANVAGRGAPWALDVLLAPEAAE